MVVFEPDKKSFLWDLYQMNMWEKKLVIFGKCWDYMILHVFRCIYKTIFALLCQSHKLLCSRAVCVYCGTLWRERKPN